MGTLLGPEWSLGPQRVPILTCWERAGRHSGRNLASRIVIFATNSHNSELLGARRQALWAHFGVQNCNFRHK